MNIKLNDEEKRVLKVLAEEAKLNPNTLLTGVDIRTLGAKVGSYRDIGVIYPVDRLQRLGLVRRRQNSVLITQKGSAYISSDNPLGISVSGVRWFRDYIIVALIVAIVAGLVVAYITGWRP